MFLNVFLLILAVQKAIDGLGSFTPLANFVLTQFLGFENIASNPLQVLLLKLWGGASLAWAYFLFQASSNPKKNLPIIDGSILGFAVLGLTGVFTPMPSVRVCGLFFLIEALILLVSRLKLTKKI
ncbi:MAG: hypothetical protein PHW62_06800 [Candidatus Ratteibacteria bacterium]|nr:hypothetical protein [Candidatus Ratteibacteria bacterium]